MSKSILIVVASAGAVGGVATGSYYLLKSDTPKKEPATAIIPKKLLEELAGDHFEALNTDPNKTDDDVQWGKLITKHLQSDYTTVPKITSNIGITSSTTNNNSANIKALKAECKRILSKTSNFEADKLTAKNWCNKKSKVLKELG